MKKVGICILTRVHVCMSWLQDDTAVIKQIVRLIALVTENIIPSEFCYSCLMWHLSK